MASPAAVLSVLVQADGIQRTNRQLQGLHGGLGTTSKAAGKMGDDLDTGAKKGSRALAGLKSAAGPAAAALGVVGIAGAVKTAVGEFQEARKVGAQTNQVIKTTGGVANVSAKHVATLATSISKKAGIDDEAIQSGSNLLLTFKNIRNETGKGKDIFDQATQAAVDLSSAGFGSLSSTSKQLGKALNDPVKGMTALGRAGVTFSDQQKTAIEALMKTGDAADRVKAQQIVLKEVQSQVGGSAAAQATTMDHLKVTLSNLAEAAGSVLVPAFDKVGKFLNTLINQMIEGKSVGGAIVSTFKTLGVAAIDVGTAIAGLVGWFKQHQTIAVALAAAVTVFALAYTASLIPALIATTAAVYAQVAGWVALKIAFLTSPIGLIVVGLAALAAAVVVAYRESETFRDIVNGAWAVIKAVAAWLITAGVAAFNAVAAAVKAAWGVVQTVTMTVWGAIKAFLMPLWTLFATVANVEFIAIRTAVQIAWFAIQTVTTTVWGAIKAFLLPLWTAIKTAASTIFGALRAVIVGEWNALSTAATTIWNLIKGAILTPIRAVRDALGGKDGIWASIHDSATAAWDRIKGALSGFAKGVKDGILDAIKGGLNILIGFVNDVIGVINSIPGVTNIKKIAKLAEGGTVSGGGPNGNGKLARGGLVGLAKGAMVPGSGSGDKVPLYLGGRLAAMVEPGEFVSVANRNATSALMDVNSQIPRFATGGVFSSTSYGPPWTGINGSGVTATGTNLRGSPHIFGVAVDPSVIALGSMLDITPNPFATKEKFKAFDTGSAIKDRRIDFYDWRGRAEQFGWGARDVRVSGIANLGQGGADSIGDILAALNPLDFIKKLPGIGDLPDWLQGTGKWILDQVGDYITSAVSGIFGGGGAGDAPEKFSHMISMANRMDAMDIPYGPQGHAGWALNQSGEDCSSSVSKVLHAAGYLTNVLTTVGLPGALEEGPGKMVTVHDRALAGNAGHTIMQIGNRFFGTSGQNPGGGPGWFSNPGAGYLSTLPTKLHPKGMAQGGVFGQGTPFVGSYRNGGVVPQDGLGYLHQGETVSPRGAGGPLVHIEHMEVSRETDVERVARSLAWKLQTG